MNTEKLLCPKCHSEDVMPLQGGSYICFVCRNEFTAPKDEKQPVRVFISYAHAQNEIAERIVKVIEEAGHMVWFDKNDIAHDDDWREKITKGIIESNGVLSCLTKEAVREGGVCLDELSIAVGVKYGKIHTVLLDKEGDLHVPPQLAHRQWLDMSDWREKQAEGDDVFNAWFEEKSKQIIAALESPESREFIGQITTIKKKLRIREELLATSRQRDLLKKKFIGREWLTEEVNDWMKNGSGRMCAVYGGPGIGKSAFAAWYSYLSPSVGASFFFEYGNASYNNARELILLLAFQLACRLPGYRQILYYHLEQDDIDRYNDHELFTLLLVEYLVPSINGYIDTQCVVLDGLDECTTEANNTVAQLLGEMNDRLPDWLKIIVLSRVESEVTSWLRPDKVIRLEDEPEHNTADLRAYFRDRLEKQLRERKDAEVLLDKLTTHAKGVFLYAYTVTEMILDGKLGIDETDAYPEDLDHTFLLYFTRYFPGRDEYRRLYKLYLGMIAASPDPIPREELDAVCGEYRAEDDSLFLRLPGEEAEDTIRRRNSERLIKRIGVFLSLGKDIFDKETITFSHKYLRDWLTRKDLVTGIGVAGEYAVTTSDALQTMTRTWRRLLEHGKEVNAYQIIHMLPYLKETEPAEKVLKTVMDKRFRKQLRREIKYNNAINKYSRLLELAKIKLLCDAYEDSECHTEETNKRTRNSAEFFARQALKSWHHEMKTQDPQLWEKMRTHITIKELKDID